MSVLLLLSKLVLLAREETMYESSKLDSSNQEKNEKAGRNGKEGNQYKTKYTERKQLSFFVFFFRDRSS
jgi:hypothetical protein